MFFVLYITKSSARTGMAARRDEIFFFLMDRLHNRSLQFRQQRWSTPKLSGESFNCAESRRTNVVFHSLYIVINDAVVEAKKSQEIRQKFVPLGDLMCQALAGCCQNKSAIFFVFQQPLGVQSLNHVGHACLRNF